MTNIVRVNNFISEEINNITKHINQQQISISHYINTFKDTIQNKIKSLDDKVQFLEHTYQIENDISFLRNHIDEIGQIIFSSKIGIIPTDILTKFELELITDFDSYQNIKTAVIFQNNNIIIILLIPQYSPNTLSQIRFEPLPNIANKSIALDTYEVLIDSENNMYETYVKKNLEKNLIKIHNKCLENILKFEEANCNLETIDKINVTEIVPGILVFKHFDVEIEHNCNKQKIKQKGNFLIKFENCYISTLNKTYSNINIKIYETFILPNRITKIKERKNVTELILKLKNLYVKQINHENSIELLMNKNKKRNLISIGTDVIIITIILITIVYIIIKSKQKLNISIEPPQATLAKRGPFLQISTPQMH
ncbi:uncharacterized protein LOC125778931 [Bactrocera dorsalis]|uniref:Uncharacterized protein LOC125778931 n=1 Tax=Bactrocera dorsalis TaxID=27457 RepID=A0ABM3JZN3_BACDO|nr:uncharacterized protein LOC125778931 [Bactrocera dorsalis]